MDFHIFHGFRIDIFLIPEGMHVIITMVKKACLGTTLRYLIKGEGTNPISIFRFSSFNLFKLF